MAGLGATPEAIKKALGAELDQSDEEEAIYKVWPENWQAVSVFLACGDQWSWLVVPGAPGVAPRFTRERLSNADVISTLKMLRIKGKRWPGLLEKIIVMRNEAMKVFQEQG